MYIYRIINMYDEQSLEDIYIYNIYKEIITSTYSINSIE